MGRAAVDSRHNEGSGSSRNLRAPRQQHFALATFGRTIVRPVRHIMSSAISGWQEFWFAPGDPTTLGVMRLLVGGMLVYTHVVWGINLEAFLGAAGWNSPDVLAVVQEGQIVPSFWWYVPDEWLWSVHFLCVGILVMFWLGLATRITSVMSMLITISYSYRAHMANFGLDQINAILCLYLCIGPSGATLSIDRWWRVWRERQLATRNGQEFIAPQVKSSSAANLAIRLTQVHFCVIYAYAGLTKLQGPAWWSGDAAWMAFANLEYQSLDMTWVAWYPWISDLVTHTTILWEVSFAALVWVRPIRPVVLAMGALMHIGIGAMMGMWTFGLVMIFGHVSFWPRQAITWVAGLFPSAERLLGCVASHPAHNVRPAFADATAATETRSAGLPASRTNPAIATAAMASAPALSGAVNDSFRTQNQAAGAQPVLKPALLCIDRAVRGRLNCLNYFVKRGYQCMVTGDLEEARVVISAAAPDAVVVVGTDMADRDIEIFHQTHFAQVNPKPLFMVLRHEQSQRLNGHIRTVNSHVLTGNVSLGTLRREIQAALSDGSENLVRNRQFSGQRARGHTDTRTAVAAEPPEVVSGLPQTADSLFSADTVAAATATCSRTEPGYPSESVRPSRLTRPGRRRVPK